MSTENGEQSTTIGHLFASESVPEPQSQEPVATEQPAAVEAAEQPQEQAPAVEAAPQAPQSHTVPLAELIETRKRAQAAEESARRQQQQIDYLTESMRRLQPQQQSQQAAPIDPVSDPDAFVSHITSVIEQKFHQQAISASEQRARKEHGNDLVETAANEAFKNGLDVYFAGRPDPHGEAIAWYQSQQLRSEIGDPAAYRQNLETELRAKILAEMKQGAPPPSNLPPSLSSATRVNGATEPIPNGRDFFNSMMNQRSR